MNDSRPLANNTRNSALHTSDSRALAHQEGGCVPMEKVICCMSLPSCLCSSSRYVRSSQSSCDSRLSGGGQVISAPVAPMAPAVAPMVPAALLLAEAKPTTAQIAAAAGAAQATAITASPGRLRLLQRSSPRWRLLLATGSNTMRRRLQPSTNGRRGSFCSHNPRQCLR